MASILSVGSAVFYGVATWCLISNLHKSSPGVRTKTGRQFSNALFWVIPALITHAVVLLYGVHTEKGFNFGISNTASLTVWMVVFVGILVASKSLTNNLGILIWPLAALTVLLAQWFPAEHLIGMDISLGVRVHAICSILAYSVLAVAACQAIFLYVFEYRLRHKRSGGLLRVFPALQTQETVLVQLIAAGFFLLSLSLISGVMFIEDFFSQHLVHKVTLSGLAWVSFAGVLWGHWYHGWRGRTLVRWFLVGFIVLVLAYFGNKLVLEVILGRSWSLQVA